MAVIAAADFPLADLRSPALTGALPALAAAIEQLGALVGGLREHVRLLEAVVSNFPGGISLFDRDLRMVLCSEGQKRLLDYPEELLKRRPTLEELFGFNAARGEYGAGSVEMHVSRRMALVRQRIAHTYERTRPNGTILDVRGVPLAGGGFLTTYLDVTEQRRAQAMIAHLAHHDPLTGLPNRALFQDRLQNAVALAKRGATAALLFLDVDGFKPVNDGFGHSVGDGLLVAIANRLTATVRENDTVARLGGDEFAVIQTGISSAADAWVLARRLQRAFEAPFDVSGAALTVSASIGVALSPRDGLSIDDLLSKADGAMYRSKTGGCGGITFHEAVAA